MDFKNLKEKALKKAKEVQKKADELTNKAVDYSAEKLAASSFTIQTKEDLEKLIEKSKETSFKNKETGVEKKYLRRSIVLFGDEKTEFFKNALYSLPVIATKAFSQNISVKLAKSNIKDIVLKDYKVDKLPSLVVFENTKILKVIAGEENILKLVKSFSLDINKGIDNIK